MDIGKATFQVSIEASQMDREIQKLTRQINALNAKLNRATSEFRDVGKTSGIDRLERKLKTLNHTLDRVTKKARGLKSSIGSLGATRGGMGLSGAIGGFAKLTTGIGAAALAFEGLQMAAREAIKIMGASLDLSIKFESSMALVKRLTGETGADLRKLERDIIQMSKEIGVSADDISKGVAAFGQLGVVGAENMKRATEWTAKASVAMAEWGGKTDEMSKKAMTILNIFQQDFPKGIDNIGEMFNMLDTVSNNTAANAKEIAEFLSRVPSSTKIFDVETVATFGAALKASGMQVSRAARLFDSATSRMLKNSATIGEVLGMTSKQWEELLVQKPMEAFRILMDGLGGIQDKAEQTRKIYAIFGTESGRVIDKLIAQFANGKFDEYMDKIAGSSKKVTLVEKEFRIAMQTTQKAIDIAERTLEEKMLRMGESLKKLLPIQHEIEAAFYDVVGTVSDVIGGVLAVFQSHTDDFNDEVVKIVDGLASVKIQQESLSSIENLSDQLIELKEKMESGGLTATEMKNAMQEEQAIMNQIFKLNPALAESYSQVADDVERLKMVKEGYIEASQRELAVTQNINKFTAEMAIDKLGEAVTDNAEALGTAFGMVEGYQQRIKQLTTEMANLDVQRQAGQVSQEEYNDAMEDLSTKYERVQEALSGAKEEYIEASADISSAQQNLSQIQSMIEMLYRDDPEGRARFDQQLEMLQEKLLRKTSEIKEDARANLETFFTGEFFGQGGFGGFGVRFAEMIEPLIYSASDSAIEGALRISYAYDDASEDIKNSTSSATDYIVVSYENAAGDTENSFMDVSDAGDVAALVVSDRFSEAAALLAEKLGISVEEASVYLSENLPNAAGIGKDGIIDAMNVAADQGIGALQRLAMFGESVLKNIGMTASGIAANAENAIGQAGSFFESIGDAFMGAVEGATAPAEATSPTPSTGGRSKTTSTVDRSRLRRQREARSAQRNMQRAQEKEQKEREKAAEQAHQEEMRRIEEEKKARENAQETYQQYIAETNEIRVTADMTATQKEIYNIRERAQEILKTEKLTQKERQKIMEATEERIQMVRLNNIKEAQEVAKKELKQIRLQRISSGIGGGGVGSSIMDVMLEYRREYLKMAQEFGVEVEEVAESTTEEVDDLKQKMSEALNTATQLHKKFSDNFTGQGRPLYSSQSDQLLAEPNIESAKRTLRQMIEGAQGYQKSLLEQGRSQIESLLRDYYDSVTDYFNAEADLRAAEQRNKRNRNSLSGEVATEAQNALRDLWMSSQEKIIQVWQDSYSQRLQMQERFNQSSLRIQEEFSNEYLLKETQQYKQEMDALRSHYQDMISEMKKLEAERIMVTIAKQITAIHTRMSDEQLLAISEYTENYRRLIEEQSIGSYLEERDGDMVRVEFRGSSREEMLKEIEDQILGGTLNIPMGNSDMPGASGGAFRVPINMEARLNLKKVIESLDTMYAHMDKRTEEHIETLKNLTEDYEREYGGGSSPLVSGAYHQRMREIKEARQKENEDRRSGMKAKREQEWRARAEDGTVSQEEADQGIQEYAEWVEQASESQVGVSGFKYDWMEVGAAMEEINRDLQVMANLISAVNDFTNAVKDGTMEWSDVTGLIASTMQSIPEPTVQIIGMVIGLATQIGKMLDDVIETAGEKAIRKAAETAREIQKELEQVTFELGQQLSLRKSYADIEEKINEILEYRLKLYKEMETFRNLSLKNLEKQAQTSAEQIEFNLSRLKELGFLQDVPDFDKSKWGEWINAFSDAIFKLGDDIEAIDEKVLEDLLKVEAAHISWLEGYKGFFGDLWSSVESGELRGDELVAAWQQRFNKLKEQNFQEYLAGDKSEQAFLEYEDQLYKVSQLITALAETQNKAYGVTQMIEAQGLVEGLVGNIKEYKDILDAIVGNQLAVFDLHRQLGILDESSVDAVDQELKLLDDALNAYAQAYGIQEDMSDLDDEKIKKLLEESGYDQEIISLLQRKIDLQDSYNDSLSDELGILSKIKDRRVQDLITEYKRVKLLEETGAITGEQAAKQKADIIRAIGSLLGELGLGQAEYDAYLKALSSIITGVGAGNIGGGGAVTSYATGTDYVPYTGLYRLHAGEAVIPAEENAKMQKLSQIMQSLSADTRYSLQPISSPTTNNASTNIHGVNITVNNVRDARSFAESFIDLIKTSPRARTAVQRVARSMN